MYICILILIYWCFPRFTDFSKRCTFSYVIWHYWTRLDSNSSRDAFDIICDDLVVSLFLNYFLQMLHLHWIFVHVLIHNLCRMWLHSHQLHEEAGRDSIEHKIEHNLTIYNLISNDVFLCDFSLKLQIVLRHIILHISYPCCKNVMSAFLRTIMNWAALSRLHNVCTNGPFTSVSHYHVLLLMFPHEMCRRDSCSTEINPK